MEKIIRVITLYQPYASLLAHGIKKNETRPGATSHTKEEGIYLIHAAKKWNVELNDLCFTEPFYTELLKLGFSSNLVRGVGGSNKLNMELPLGKIIGSFEVKECLTVVGAETCIKTLESSVVMVNMDDKEEQSIPVRDKEIKFGDYSLFRSIWIGQNHKVLVKPIDYKGGQGYYQKFKGDINQLIFK